VYTVIVPDACLRCLDLTGVQRLRANISMATGAEDQAAGPVSWYQSRRRRRTMTTTEIRAEIRQRNAVRRAALLPLLDEQREFDHACAVIREQRYRALKESKQADCERIRQEVFAERGGPRGFLVLWGWSIEIDRRVDAFLRANYADEIATLMQIGPDYLSITRQVVDDGKGTASPTT
jgi:hypothetical protein